MCDAFTSSLKDSKLTRKVSGLIFGRRPNRNTSPRTICTAVLLVVPGMLDSETVAFVGGECDASSMKVAVFHSAPAASSRKSHCFHSSRLVIATWHFLVARRAFVTFRRVRSIWVPKSRYDCAPCCCKMLSTVLYSVSPAVAQCIFHF